MCETVNQFRPYCIFDKIIQPHILLICITYSKLSLIVDLLDIFWVQISSFLKNLPVVLVSALSVDDTVC